MKAKLIEKVVTKQFNFQVTIDSKEYDVTIWLDPEKNKFMDDVIRFNGEMLGCEGTEGEIREKILDFLDKEWENLVQ